MNNKTSTEHSSSTKEELKEVKVLLDWTSKQGRILTANGKAESYYTAERGYPYKEEELPHYHLISKKSNSACDSGIGNNNNSSKDIGSDTRNNTYEEYSSWAKERRQILKEKEGNHAKDKESDNNNIWEKYNYPVCGAWTRPLFVGDWEHTTGSEDEIVFNIQTNTLFIDMRIPRLAKVRLESPVCHDDPNNHSDDRGHNISALGQMDDYQLRLYARRHAFAGYTVLDHHFDKDSKQSRIVCTRHHCIDWNFVGKGRNRPNKWYVELRDSSVWKEWSFARDEFNQHYYWERWERLKNDANGKGLVLALRKKSNENNGKGGEDRDTGDGIIVVVGDHFNYIFSRKMNGTEKTYCKGNLVDTVDAAIEAGDRNSAESYLSIDAGHGTISSGWIIDCALQFWKEGKCLFSGKDDTFSLDKSEGCTVETCGLSLNKSLWEVYECSLDSLEDLEFVLQWRAKEDHSTQLDRILTGQSSSIISRKRKIRNSD